MRRSAMIGSFKVFIILCGHCFAVNARVLLPVDRVPSGPLTSSPRQHDARGDRLHRVAMYPDDAARQDRLANKASASALERGSPSAPSTSSGAHTGIAAASSCAMRYCARAIRRQILRTIIPIGTRHHAVGVITLKIESPRALALRQTVAEHVVVGVTDQPFAGGVARISRQSASARARRGSSGPAKPGGGEGYITSQKRSDASRSDQPTAVHAAAWSRNAPGPSRTAGRSIFSSAMGQRLASSKNLQPRRE